MHLGYQLLIYQTSKPSGTVFDVLISMMVHLETNMENKAFCTLEGYMQFH